MLFALILIIRTGVGISLTNIPGYATENACNQAGNAFKAKIPDWMNSQYVCIPDGRTK